MSNNITFGSVCSGIEASQLAFQPYGFKQLWSSEIADFPSKVLDYHYSDIPNMGDMENIPDLILEKKIDAPDILCGGTPCQAFSLAGWKNGLLDKRGQLTMTFIDIADAIDSIRSKKNQDSAIILWENVEGVLNDKTNAFGNFISGLAGLDDEIKVKKWTKSGFLKGKTRNVAWRVLDARFFGLPQQRKRLFVLAGGKNFRPDKVLFEIDNENVLKIIKSENTKPIDTFDLFSNPKPKEGNHQESIFYKDGHKFEIFRDYTDCLYSAYATKWNGNAAAYNGSLYLAQNDRIRRLIPIECERLMGFPDNYTLIAGNSDTNRYHAIGNSWAVPVVKWIGKKIYNYLNNINQFSISWEAILRPTKNNIEADLFLLNNINQLSQKQYLNTSIAPNNPVYGELENVAQALDVPEKFYLSAKACQGILRRKREKNMKMNFALEKLMERIGNQELVEK